MNIWEGVKQLGLKYKKTNIIKSFVCLLLKSSFLLKKTKEKDFLKINRDFIKISIHQIDNRPKFSFTSSQLFAFCKMNILHWSGLWNSMLLIGSVIIGSVGRWVGGRLVGGSANKWSLVGWSLVGIIHLLIGIDIMLPV